MPALQPPEVKIDEVQQQQFERDLIEAQKCALPDDDDDDEEL